MSVTQLVNFVTEILIVEKPTLIDGHRASLVTDSLHRALHIISSPKLIRIESTAVLSLPRGIALRSPLLQDPMAPCKGHERGSGTERWRPKLRISAKCFPGQKPYF